MSLAFDAPPPILAPMSDGRSFPVRRIYCVGRNYADHAREMGSDPTREPPFFFTKWADTVTPPGAPVHYPSSTRNYHFEGELVVALGSGGRNIPRERALDCVFGSAAGLDMTRRDLQSALREIGRPWDVAKNFDGAAPLGLIHPVAETPLPMSGLLELRVNGVVRQTGDLSDMIWPTADIIAFLSGYYELAAGDLIFTGTPSGVGAVLPGDQIEVSIAGLSPLSVRIAEAI